MQLSASYLSPISCCISYEDYVNELHFFAPRVQGIRPPLLFLSLLDYKKYSFMIFLEEYPDDLFEVGSLRLFAPTNEPLGIFLGWNSKLVN